MSGSNTARIRSAAALQGEVRVPGDKSVSHRALMFAAMAAGTTGIRNLAPGADVRSTASVLRSLGVAIDWDGDRATVRSGGHGAFVAPDGPLDCGNSGTTMRLMMGILAGCGFDATLIGDESLSGRPMERIATPLRTMGADIALSAAGTAPVTVRGAALEGIEWESRVASAQVKSAILLAGLSAAGHTRVTEPARSRDHTELMLADMGVPVTVDGLSVSVPGGSALQPAKEILVPGDLSSAAFWLVAGLLRGEGITVRDVGLNPTRTGVLDALRAMGASFEINRTSVGGEPVGDIVVSRQVLRGAELSGELVVRAIDEIPILAVLATQARGRTVITDAHELRVKECDRLATMADVLQSMGARVSELDDGLIIDGPTPLRPAVVRPRHDHRIAMSAAVAALCVDGDAPTVIEDADAASVSYPAFYEHLDGLRA